jgi:hypothetical protein
MSPSRRSPGTYRPKRDRREVTIAVATGVAIVLFTVLMVWILGPHDSGGDSSPSTTTAPTVATTAPAGGSTPTSTPDSTPASTGAPATSAPAGGG